jgi:hypothetical protein
MSCLLRQDLPWYKPYCVSCTWLKSTQYFPYTTLHHNQYICLLDLHHCLKVQLVTAHPCG